MLLPLVVTGLIVYIVANAFPIAQEAGSGKGNLTSNHSIVWWRYGKRSARAGRTGRRIIHTSLNV
uniref:Uncharacterized protein n=1 Tax=Ralstonia solanacearum TaxID=305 RepID=A0A0S4XJP5_RALSL|nr:protein of unknown function [Ralstonia solanacearum]